MELQKIYRLFLNATGVSTDTRNLEKGNLFFALSGDHFDGNRFAVQALEKGALAVVVDHPEHVPLHDNRIIAVENSLKTLQALARHHRQQFDIPLLAITGTNGKTTTKELCAAVLSSQKNICATRGNLNNHIGVPLTLLRINKQTEAAIVEMGANHPGEIAALCQLAAPTHGLITNIGKAHLEGFGNFRGVVNAKNELYVAVKANEGTVFVHKDNPLLMQLSTGIPRITYGTPPADCAGNLKPNGPFVQVEWQHNANRTEITTHLFGRYNFSNIMAAITVGQHFGIETTRITEAISRYKPQNNRSQLIRTENNTIILDAYNANPESMALAIDDFSRQGFRHPVVILGDMFELGKHAPGEHKKIADKLENREFDDVLLAGDVFFHTPVPSTFKKFKTTEELIRYLEAHPVKGTTILVKGSRGMQLEKVIQYL